MPTTTAVAAGGNWTVGATWDTGIAPTAADDVVINASSGAVTINAASVCRSLDCTGYTNTLTHNAFTLTIGDATAGAGNVAIKLVSGMTYTRASQTSSAITFVSTSATQQSVDWAGKQTSNINFNGTGSWKVITTTSAIWTMNGSSSGSFTHTKGTIDLNGCDLRTGVYTTAFANTRSITFGAAVISCSNTGNAFNFNSGIAQLTKVDSPTSVTLTGNGSTTFLGGLDWSATTFIFSSTAHTVSAGAGLSTALMGEVRRIAGTGVLDFSSGTVVGIGTVTVTGARTITFLSGATYNITTALSVAGTDYTNFATLNASTANNIATLNISGTSSVTNTHIKDIAVTGTSAPINIKGNANADSGDTSGIIFGSQNLNNFQFLSAGDGMSVTERIK